VAIRVVVLASGTGSLLKALIEAQDESFEVVALVTDNAEAGAIGHAATAGVQVAVIDLVDFETRDAWDLALADCIDFYQPDLVVSAGFMRIIGQAGVSRFAGRLINTHPALLPNFPGAHAVRDALAAGAKETGSTVHFVDAGVDTGPVIVQKSVPVLDSDDEASLHERIKVVERELLVEVVKDFAGEKKMF
jgi:phosphoribosylglycinamide formyltransferase-1